MAHLLANDHSPSPYCVGQPTVNRNSSVASLIAEGACGELSSHLPPPDFVPLDHGSSSRRFRGAVHCSLRESLTGPRPSFLTSLSRNPAWPEGIRSEGRVEGKYPLRPGWYVWSRG